MGHQRIFMMLGSRQKDSKINSQPVMTKVSSMYQLHRAGSLGWVNALLVTASAAPCVAYASGATQIGFFRSSGGL